MNNKLEFVCGHGKHFIHHIEFRYRIFSIFSILKFA